MEKQNLINMFFTAFRKSCTPPNRPFEYAKEFIALAAADLADETKSEETRYASAMRLLTCIPEIGEALRPEELDRILRRI